MTRLVAILAILVAGVCTTAMNWRFSYQLGTSAWDSYTWAIFSAALGDNEIAIHECYRRVARIVRAKVEASAAIRSSLATAFRVSVIVPDF